MLLCPCSDHMLLCLALLLTLIPTRAQHDVVRKWTLGQPGCLDHSYMDVHPHCPELTVLGNCEAHPLDMSTTCNNSCRLHFQYQDLITAGTIMNATDLLVYNAVPERATLERIVWVFITSITNFLALPFLLRRHVLVKDHLVFESVLTVFTVGSSFCYHFCDSMDYVDRSHVSGGMNGLFLGKGKWHKLDNIGANLCFIVLLVHLTNYKKAAHAELNKFIGLWFILYCQEKNAWSLFYTIGPILLQCAILVVHWTIIDEVPKIDMHCLKRSVMWQTLAFVCFYKGLDEQHDAYRLFHGFWHCFSGLASVYHWQLIHSNRETGKAVKSMKFEV
jgi:hypothetical protein